MSVEKQREEIYKRRYQTMSFNDIFKSSFLENVTSVSLLDMFIALALAFCIGLFIFFVYKKTFAGVMYSAGFGVSLIALTMITTLVILAVTSNVVLSLGMVGALSIVRFRSAIKEPLDIAYLFWAIAAGIVLAAGMIPLAVFGSVIIGVVLIVFSNVRGGVTQPFVLVMQCESAAVEKLAMQYLAEHSEKNRLKSKSVQNGAVELTIEIRLKDGDTDFVNALSEIEGVRSAVLVSFNGEYMS